MNPSADAPAQAGADASPGQTLGDFRLLREIGRGGMGVVYEAEQVSLERRVALKVLPPASALDEGRLQRFRIEAQATALLHHAHIVPVHFVGCERGVHFFAMQLIHGSTLASLLHARQRQGDPSTATPDDGPPTSPYVGPESPGDPSPPPASWVTLPRTSGAEYFRAAARIGEQVADALDHAHAHGVIHRDIKPGNLLIEAGGHVWVTDFGLAHLAGDESLTRTGDLIGTLRYMSPEQVLGSRVPIDHRTDIYSLGVTLYEALTGRPAWSGQDRQELIRQILSDEPAAPRRLDRSIPVELETIVLKAMARNPVERYATAGELADDLRAFLDDRPIKARRASIAQRLARWGRRHRALVASAVAILLVAVVALSVSTVLVWQEKGRVEVQRDRAEMEEGRAKQKEEEARLAAARETEQRRRAERLLLLGLEALNEAFIDVAADRLPRGQDRSPEEDRLLRRVLVFYDAYTREAPDDPAAQARIAEAYRRVATIHMILGQLDEGLAVIDQGVERFDALSRQLPDRASVLRGLEIAHSTRGIILDLAGRTGEARKAHERALAVCEQLPPSREGESETRHAATLHNLAMLAFDQGDYPEAIRLVDRAIPLQRAAVRKRSGDHVALEFLLNHYTLRGNSRIRLGRFDVAEADLGQAFRLASWLVQLRPGQRLSRQRLAAAYTARALLADHAGRREDALALAVRGGDIEGELYSRYPRVVTLRRQLARTSAFVGELCDQAGRHEEAVRSLESAVRLGQRLVEDVPGVPAHVQELNQWEEKLSRVLCRKDAPEGDLAKRRHEIRVLEKRLATTPLRAYRVGLIRRLDTLARLLFEEQGKPAEALPLARRAYRSSGEYLAASPADPDAKEWVAFTGQNLALVLRALKQPDEALELHEVACRTRRGLLASRGSPDDRADLAWALSEQGLTLTDLDRLDEAARDLDEALAIQRALVKASRNAERLGRLGGILHNRALVHTQRRQWAQAARLYREAIREQDAALKLNPGDGNSLRFLSNHHTSLSHVCAQQGDAAAAAEALEQLVEKMRTRPAYFGGHDAMCHRLGLWQHGAALALFQDNRHREGEAAELRSHAWLCRMARPGPDALRVGAIVLHNLGRAQYQRGQYDAARRLQEESIRRQCVVCEAAPSASNSRTLVSFYHQFAMLLLRKKDHDYAARILEVLAKVRPKEYTDARLAAVLLGRCAALAGGRGEEYRARARRHSERAVRLCPADPQAQNDLAGALLLYPGLVEPKIALALVRRALARKPSEGGFHHTLAVALYRAGSLADAVKALERSRELRKGGDAHEDIILALVYAKRRDLKPARALYDRAVTWRKSNAADNAELLAFEQEVRGLLKVD